jgi:hypothetical protein
VRYNISNWPESIEDNSNPHIPNPILNNYTSAKILKPTQSRNIHPLYQSFKSKALSCHTQMRININKLYSHEGKQTTLKQPNKLNQTSNQPNKGSTSKMIESLKYKSFELCRRPVHIHSSKQPIQMRIKHTKVSKFQSFQIHNSHSGLLYVFRDLGSFIHDISL